MDQVYDMLITE